MVGYMYHYLYALPKYVFVLIGLGGLMFWFLCRVSGFSKKYEKAWKFFNTAALIFVIIFVFFAALIYRIDKPQDRILRLRPFQFLIDMKYSLEYLRLALLNTLVFIPFGLCIPELIEKKYSPIKVIIITVSTAFLISLTVEIAQYVFNLGVSEFDDLMLNTFGAALGTIPFIVTQKWRKRS